VGVSDGTGSSGDAECSKTDAANKPRVSPPGSASHTPHRAEWCAAEATGMTRVAFSNPRTRLSRRSSARSVRRNVFGRYSRSVGDCSSRNADDCNSRKQAAVAS
jgi:hypothetical protein